MGDSDGAVLASRPRRHRGADRGEPMTEFIISRTEKASVVTSIKVGADSVADAIEKASKYAGGYDIPGAKIIDQQIYCFGEPEYDVEAE